jgi:DNA primase
MYLDSFVESCFSSIPRYPEALDYLRLRGITLDDINKYQIGYTKLGSVPKVNSEDYDYLYDKTYGFKYLRERIIIPLRNMLGHVNGLVTREMNNDGRRYVIYLLKEAKKVGGFFGLYEALPYIMRTRKVFVHEGAIDALSFAKVFPNTISTLTSFINESQFEILDMLADKIILVFDNDKAGNYGIQKMKDTYGTKKIEAISLGDNDANDYLKIKSVDEYRKFITNKIPFMLRG